MQNFIFGSLLTWVSPILFTIVISIITGIISSSFLSTALVLLANLTVTYGLYVMYTFWKSYYQTPLKKQETAIQLLLAASAASLLVSAMSLFPALNYFGLGANVCSLIIFVLTYIAYAYIAQDVNEENLLNVWKIVGILELISFVGSYISFLSYLVLVLDIIQLLFIIKFVVDLNKILENK